MEGDLKPLMQKTEAVQGKLLLMGMDIDSNAGNIKQLAEALDEVGEVDTSELEAKLEEIEGEVKDMAIDCFFWKCAQDVSGLSVP